MFVEKVWRPCAIESPFDADDLANRDALSALIAMAVGVWMSCLYSESQNALIRKLGFGIWIGRADSLSDVAGRLMCFGIGRIKANSRVKDFRCALGSSSSSFEGLRREQLIPEGLYWQQGRRSTEAYQYPSSTHTWKATLCQVPEAL